MNVVQAIQALREHSDQLQDPLPEALFRREIPALVESLRDMEVEELQHRSTQEWEDLLAEESDPLEAAKLVLDWIADKAQARQKEEG